MARKGTSAGLRSTVPYPSVQLYPGGLKNVKDKVQEGQFQPVGGAWVSSSFPLPSIILIPTTHCIIGRARCEHALRRSFSPSTSPRTTILPVEVRHKMCHRMAARLLRVEW